MVNRNTTQNKQEYRLKEKMLMKYLDKKKRVLFMSKLEQMEVAYNNNETYFIKK